MEITDNSWFAWLNTWIAYTIRKVIEQKFDLVQGIRNLGGWQMISKIELKTTPFNSNAQSLDTLKTFNYFFGANGSGKTTISRIIAQPEDYASCGITWKNGTHLKRESTTGISSNASINLSSKAFLRWAKWKLILSKKSRQLRKILQS